MTTMIENYLREVGASLRVDPARKRQILDELRTHLTEKADEVQAADPARPREEIEQEVLREFGNPRDLALAYEPDGTAVLRGEAGAIVLRLGQAMGRGAAAVGRGTGTFLKWTAATLGVLLVLSLCVGAWAYYEVKPYIPAILESADPVYQYYERCGDTPCNGSPPADVFYVREGAQTVKFELDVFGMHADRRSDGHLGNGTLRVVVTDAEGTPRLDRTFNMTDASGTRQELSWAAQTGNWTVSYTFVEFVGRVDVRAHAIALPFRDAP